MALPAAVNGTASSTMLPSRPARMNEDTGAIATVTMGEHHCRSALDTAPDEPLRRPGWRRHRNHGPERGITIQHGHQPPPSMPTGAHREQHHDQANGPIAAASRPEQAECLFRSGQFGEVTDENVGERTQRARGRRPTRSRYHSADQDQARDRRISNRCNSLSPSPTPVPRSCPAAR